ncbi:MAG TPA: nickel pincer cofactor biosynthesis protein LarC [Anaerolineae bacterium]|nr:nickel pincer cofactor biosynthesis protein LarC [Anaerolineae bacterium]
MKIAYFDCFAGVSGDMILGALLDAGLDAQALHERLRGLNLPGWELDVRRVRKHELAATQVTVVARGESPERTLGDIEALIGNSDLAPAEKPPIAHIFQRLAEAEARVHGCSPAEVHFHEVGAIDAIVDVACAVCGLNLLGVEAVHASPLPLGRGFTRSAHGRLPLPAPAVVELLRGVPVIGMETEGETVTPTGAAILTTLAKSFGPLLSMRLSGVGYGAGQRDTEYPNALRVLLGETEASADTETVLLIETNIDDMNPQLYEHVFARLFAAGALDVWLSPVHMKKNRPGNVLSVLCQPAQEAAVSDVVFRETTTLGLRRQPIERRSLSREIRTVSTRFGPVRVKLALANGQVLRAVPEYEDCKRLAEVNAVPLRDVLTEVEQAAKGGSHGNPDLI